MSIAAPALTRQLMQRASTQRASTQPSSIRRLGIQRSGMQRPFVAAPRRARGFALVPALFLLIVLGLLAVIAVRIATGQQQTVTMALVEARALAAAQAGIEWGAYESLNAGHCAATTTLALSEAALNGFTVVVTCSAQSFANGTSSANSYVLQSTATYGTYGQPGYVKRVVSGTYSSAT